MEMTEESKKVLINMACLLVMKASAAIVDAVLDHKPDCWAECRLGEAHMKAHLSENGGVTVWVENTRSVSHPYTALYFKQQLEGLWQEVRQEVEEALREELVITE